MGRIVGALALLLLGLMAPIVLLAGALGAMTAAGHSGSSSPYIEQLRALGYENGRLPPAALGAVVYPDGRECLVARVGAADRAWVGLVEAAKTDAVVIEGGWCYRTYASQAAAWNRRRCFLPGNCDGDPHPPTARPGTSLHGWGLAIDVWGPRRRLLSCTSPELLWLRLNAPRFGWIHPEWARCGQSGAEPWHWEYVGSGLTAPTGNGGP